MRVIRHQTPSENLNSKTPQLFGHEIEIGYSIAFGLEDGDRSYTPLGDVMRITRRYNSRNTRHVRTLVELCVFSQE
jgi:hypothetical protein